MKTENVARGLVIGDIHFGAADPEKLMKELDEGFFEYAEQVAGEIDFIVVDGDLTHRKLSMNERSAVLCVRFMDKLVGFCYQNDIKLRMVRGTKTHEFSQLENFRHFETQFDFRIYNAVDVEELFPGLTVLWLPEEYMENEEEYYREFVESLGDEVKYDMVFGHGTWDFAAFDDQQQESERSIKGAPVFKFRDWEPRVWGPIIFGHIHGRHAYKNKVYYTGSYTRWCHGEPKPKGFIDVTYSMADLTHKVRFIENRNAPEFVTVKLSDIVDPEADIDTKVAAIQEYMQHNENVKVKIGNETESSDIAILKEAFSSDGTVAIDVTDKLERDREEEKDETFDFILNRELDVANTIVKYNEITKGVTIPLSFIEELIADGEEIA